MIDMKTINVKLLRTCVYGKIHDIVNIDISKQQLDALVKHKFIKVRKTNQVEHNECILKDIKDGKKKKGKK